MTAFFLHSFAGQLLKIQALLKAHFLMKYQMLLRIGYISRINPTGLVAIYFQLSPSSLEDGLISRRVKFVSLWLPFKGKLFLIKSKQEISRAMAALLKDLNARILQLLLGEFAGRCGVFWLSCFEIPWCPMGKKQGADWIFLYAYPPMHSQHVDPPPPPNIRGTLPLLESWTEQW